MYGTFIPWTWANLACKNGQQKPTAIAIVERLVGALCSPRLKALLQKTYI
jgi:hypothetical protein